MMRLCEALRVQKGEVVSFVGAGGKTHAMYGLGRELAGQGWRVIVTTTTHIRPPELQAGEELIVADDLAQAMDSTRKTLLRNSRPKRGYGRNSSLPPKRGYGVPMVTLATQLLPAENKLQGVPPEWVASLSTLADVVLIEADGSRGLPIKAPAAHEPVVPVETTLLVPVVGVDAVGFPLNETTAHRPALVAALTGLTLGDVLTPAAVAALLVHPQGALKGAPERARVAPLINKVEDEGTLSTARQIAALVKGTTTRESETRQPGSRTWDRGGVGAASADLVPYLTPAVDRVLIGAVATEDPIVECWRRVSAVVLAAGGSTRLGRTKQLLPLAGTTMIERVLQTVRQTGADETIVVLGHDAAEVAAHVPAGCRVVVNADWEAGISSSLQAGLEAVDPQSEAALFVLADQPLLTHAALQQILQAYYGTTRAIVAPVHHGQRGSPALFDRRMFPTLRALHGDVGGRQVIRQFPDEVLRVEMEAPEMFHDVDTAADYEELLKRGDCADSRTELS